MSALHELNPTSRFSDRANDYVKFRPSYPPAAIYAVIESLGPPAHIRAADIGAGTGISARLLADRGVRVIAIEPNATMRAAAEPHALAQPPQLDESAGKVEASREHKSAGLLGRVDENAM